VIPSNATAPEGRERAVQAKGSNMIKPYFRRNIGTEKIVFKEAHPYFQRSSHDIKKGKSHQFMAEENYGMRPAEKIVLDPNLPDLDIAKSIEDAKELWDNLPKKVKTADGIDFDLSNQWEHIVKENVDNRWKYINNAMDVLQNADEVWSSVDESGDMKIYKRYIKYYKDEPVVFSYEVGQEDKWTMYKSRVDETGGYSNLRNWTRRGQLIHRK
jgi:hypothetical protein